MTTWLAHGDSRRGDFGEIAGRVSLDLRSTDEVRVLGAGNIMPADMCVDMLS